MMANNPNGMMTIDATAQGASASTDWNPWRWRIALAVFAALGAGLAACPHGVWLLADGDPMYFADRDEWLYLCWSRGVILNGDGVLSDAIHRESGPMMHPWPLFAPIGWTARLLGLEMEQVGILWRAAAGAGMALGFVAALRGATPSRLILLGLAVFLMFDPGVSFGQPLYRDAVLIRRCLELDGELFPGTPDFLNHLRVPSPGLAIPFYLLFLGLIAIDRLRNSRPTAIYAGLALGALLHLYFYFWTVAVLGLAAAILLDRGHRRSHALILAIGLAIGAPALALNARIKAITPPDWLSRTEKFVPIGHCDELLFPVVLIAGWLIAGAWVWRGRRELLGIWCVAGAGIIGLNHQILTGVQIENFHWHQPAGLALSILWARLAAPWLTRSHAHSRSVRIAFRLAVAAQVLLGFGFRVLESLRTAESRECRAAAQALPRKDWPIPDGSVVGGDIRLQWAAAVLKPCYPVSGRLTDFSSKADDEELDHRLVLGLWMQGWTLDDARQALARPEGLKGWFEAYPRRPQGARERIARRLRLADQVWSDPASHLRRFEVSHLIYDARQLLPFGGQVQPALIYADQRTTIWRLSK